MTIFKKYYLTKLSIVFMVMQIIAPSCLANSTQNGFNGKNTKRLECNVNSVKTSKAAIEVILNDLDSTYSEIGGGGISEIKQIRTSVYFVSIPQEEKIDQFTYEISVDDSCKAKILKKETSTKSFQK